MSLSSLVVAPDLGFATEFAKDISEGMCRTGQKELPSKYLYDELGSILFDAITVLPEYGLTRADSRLLQFHAGEMVKALPEKFAVVELGSGTGSKTRFLLQSASRQHPVRYQPIDISETALEKCKSTLSDIPGVTIDPVNGSYLEGLEQVTAHRKPGESLLVLFLGSTIGNFDSEAAPLFLQEVRQLLQRGDMLLLGTDLRKPLSQMIPAYDDALGVTAAFNLNLLSRMNREVGASFVIRQFQHEARFHEQKSRIEMHIRSLQRQSVRIEALNRTISFEPGETIWTESSYKFQQSDIHRLAEKAGFGIRQQWVDREWPFAETLMQVA